jgi:hypothetical protein
LTSPTENTVIATLNILIRLAKDNNDLISRVKKELPVMVAQLDGLKLKENTVIVQFAEDLQFVFK